MTKAQQTATDLLNLHEGGCSVPRNGPLHLAFCEMQEAGEPLRFRPSGTEGFVDVYGKQFKPRFEKPEEA